MKIATWMRGAFYYITSLNYTQTYRAGKKAEKKLKTVSWTSNPEMAISIAPEMLSEVARVARKGTLSSYEAPSQDYPHGKYDRIWTK